MAFQKRFLLFLLLVTSGAAVFLFLFVWSYNDGSSGSSIKSTPNEDSMTFIGFDNESSFSLSPQVPQSHPRAVIYYLTQASRASQLRTSLLSVHTYFNCRYAYPIVLFVIDMYEKELRELNQWIHDTLFTTPCECIRNCNQPSRTYNITIVHIEDQFPPGLEAANVPQTTMCSQHSVGYRHMCRFNAILLHHMEYMQKFEYYWRFDDDSVVQQMVNYDPFRVMHDNDLVYGFNTVTTDSENCMIGLYELGVNFTEQNPRAVHPRAYFDQWPRNWIYYNNFEISKLSFWQSQNVSLYLSAVDTTYNIYMKRWGDAAIKTHAVTLFSEPSQSHHFCDILVRHQFMTTGSSKTEKAKEKLAYF